MGRYSNQDVILLRLRALLALPPLSGDVRSSVVGRKVKQRQRRLRVGEVDDLVAGYEAGTQIDDLADKFGIHRATVHAHLNRRGIDRRSSPGLAPDQIVQAAMHYTGGESLLTVARRFSVDAETIRTRLRDAGVEIRPRRGWGVAAGGEV